VFWQSGRRTHRTLVISGASGPTPPGSSKLPLTRTHPSPSSLSPPLLSPPLPVFVMTCMCWWKPDVTCCAGREREREKKKKKTCMRLCVTSLTDYRRSRAEGGGGGGGIAASLLWSSESRQSLYIYLVARWNVPTMLGGGSLLTDMAGSGRGFPESASPFFSAGSEEIKKEMQPQEVWLFSFPAPACPCRPHRGRSHGAAPGPQRRHGTKAGALIAVEPIGVQKTSGVVGIFLLGGRYFN